MSKRVGLVVSLVVLVLFVATLAGCGEKSEESSGTQTNNTTTTDNTQDNKDEVKTYEIGDKATLEDGEITVTGVKVTNDIASPEANALLLTGGPGESANMSKVPASGKEFLMITFLRKNSGSMTTTTVTPSELGLANAKDVSYTLVETSGYGGVYNSNPLQPGEQASVTAVYEVPQGETGLVLTYEKFGSSPIKFKIR